LEQWLGDFPVTEKKRNELRKDIQTAKKLGSKAFELFLYNVFAGAGIKVEPDPTMPEGHPSQPDFLIRVDGSEFYVEARFLDFSLLEVALPTGPNELIGYLTRTLKRNGFVLSVRIVMRPPAPPPLRVLKDQIERELRATNSEKGGIWVKSGDWKLEVRFQRLPNPNSKGSLGFTAPGMRMPDNGLLIREAIHGKRGQHKGYGDRMVYAIGVEAGAATVDGFLQACYGVPEVEQLSGDPLWGGSRPMASPMVLGCLGAGFAAFASAQLFCLHAPGQPAPLLPNITNFVLRDGQVERINTGASTHELLGLSPSWPDTLPK